MHVPRCVFSILVTCMPVLVASALAIWVFHSVEILDSGTALPISVELKWGMQR